MHYTPELGREIAIDMVLHCPACVAQHIDAPEASSQPDGMFEGDEGWDNPPHRSHMCAGCGHIWRPADVPTNGVEATKTTGKNDSPIASRPPAGLLQYRVYPWLMACFGPAIASDRHERNHRFLEESLELVQACGCTAVEAHQLVDYVYGRPVGEKDQEVGGVMITLAALCLANSLNMHEAGERELARIWTMVEKIRAKQAAKPKNSPLAEAVHWFPVPPVGVSMSHIDDFGPVWSDGIRREWRPAPAESAGPAPAERWYVGSMNDDCFIIINKPPRPSHDYPVHDADVDCITGFPSNCAATFKVAQAICDAHNAALGESHE